MDKQKETLYVQVKELHKMQEQLGKKNFWTLVRGYTGQNYRGTIEKIPPHEITYVLTMFRDNCSIKPQETE